MKIVLNPTFMIIYFNQFALVLAAAQLTTRHAVQKPVQDKGLRIRPHSYTHTATVVNGSSRVDDDLLES